LTKTIVTDHNGQIEVQSDTSPGSSGTTFVVTLPGAKEAIQTAGE
jgi:nitrogen-specific signal transduction histidine kinase